MNKEVVITIGFPGCGKTTYIQQYLSRGYRRINRDSLGKKAKLKDVNKLLDAALDNGDPRSIVLDNTYGTIEQRKAVIDVCKKHDVTVRADWLTASLENAQWLACFRMMEKYGKILSPKEIKASKDPNTFPPIAQYGYRKKFEKPSLSEGFKSIGVIPFQLKLPADYDRSAIIFDYDGTLRTTKSGEKYPRKPDDIAFRYNAYRVIARELSKYDYLLGISNQSGVHKGKLSYQDAVDCFEKTNELVGHNIEYVFCPHRSAPPSCFCRKPAPGWGVYFVHKYKLDPKKVLFVGDLTSDKTFASRSLFNFIHADEFF